LLLLFTLLAVPEKIYGLVNMLKAATDRNWHLNIRIATTANIYDINLERTNPKRQVDETVEHTSY